MVRYTRTKRQIKANSLDLAAFNLVHGIEELASDLHSAELEDAARKINALRWHVRKHMHPKEREETKYG